MKILTEDVLGMWQLFTLQNDHGMEVEILNYGGVITKIKTPNKNGEVENVVLGYKDIQDYETNPFYLGSVIGRVAGRIQDAEFEWNGIKYQLEQNDGTNNLHSGSNGYHRQVWETETFQGDSEVGVVLSYLSRDGESGFPGDVHVRMTYTLTNENKLILDYQATSEKDTPLTLTNHTYFNLSGNLKETIHDHHVQLPSSQFVELDHSLIPTGKIVDVAENSTFDFRQGRRIRQGIERGSEQNKIVGNGYDHYFIFDTNEDKKVLVEDRNSGRSLTVETTQPGMVMYTGNKLLEGTELNERKSTKHLGICFETQGSPASLHHSNLPNIMVKAGERYKHQTTFTFHPLISPSK
ncbi:aldose epimerase family protein [Bacillaceae bacterium S4-13-58]